MCGVGGGRAPGTAAPKAQGGCIGPCRPAENRATRVFPAAESHSPLKPGQTRLSVSNQKGVRSQTKPT